MKLHLLLIVIMLAGTFSCESDKHSISSHSTEPTDSLQSFAIQAPVEDSIEKNEVHSPPIDYDTTQWTEIIRLDPTILLDLRYATDSNFVGQQMYECGRCFLRPGVANAIVRVQQQLKEQGFGLKLYDCYRPRPIQWKLWEKVPDRRYVADPRKGSMHNRGLAVDLTIVDSTGQELPMGTPYDYFGIEAYPAYRELPEAVLSNRDLLHSSMNAVGFNPTRTEWWHFSLPGQGGELSDMLWKCY